MYYLINAVACRMPGFSKLTLSAKEHGPQIVKQFNELRTSVDNGLCDCTIMVEGKSHPIHRSFLAACSPYFKALFTLKMKESTSAFVDIHGVSAQTFTLVIDFLYTGEIALSETNITDVYAAAKFLQLELLQKICSDYFLNQLCASNCLGIWRYACTFSDSHLERCAWTYLCSNFIEVSKSEEFLNISKSEISQILSSDCLDVANELDTYTAVVRWIQHDLSNRKNLFTKLLSNVRFSLLPSHSLATLTDTDLFISTELKKVLIQAKNAKRLRSTKSRQGMPSFKKSNLLPRKGTKRMVVAGGYVTGVVRKAEVYCEQSVTWQPADIDMHFCESIHWFGVIGLRFYVIGGHSLTQTNLVMTKLTTTGSRMLRSTALSTEWECEATLPVDCSGMEFCVMDECLYACGETVHEGNSVFAITRYDPSTGNWEFLSILPNRRVAMGLVAYGGRLYLIGGIDPNPIVFLNIFESYDPKTNTWESHAPMPTSRYHLTAVSLGECIYAIGGTGDQGMQFDKLFSTVECYSTRSNQWSQVCPLPTPASGMASCVWKGNIYVFGGERMDAVHSEQVLCLDLHLNEWTRVPSLRNARIYPNAILI